MNIKFVTKKITNMLFVKDIKCIACNSELNSDKKYCICDDCNSKLPRIEGRVCEKCGTKIYGDSNLCFLCNREKRKFKIARSVLIYKDLARKLVIDFKFYYKKYLAQYLSDLLFDKYIELGWQCDVVIPVPMYAVNLAKRGYNQAKELCVAFEKILPIYDDVVIKEKRTMHQSSATYRQRKTNLKGCFKVVKPEIIKDKNILIIDDIFTTGNTVNEISKELNKFKVANIYILTICSNNINARIQKINW